MKQPQQPEFEHQFGPLHLHPQRRPKVMAAINVSPESFYEGSIAVSKDAIRQKIQEAAEAGADIIDIGAMSTAPYKETEISVDEEIERMVRGVTVAAETCSLPISADTQRAAVAEAALDAGAVAINDISGLTKDQEMAPLAAKRGCTVVIMASHDPTSTVMNGEPIFVVRSVLDSLIRHAERAGIDRSKIVADPGIGFFREQHLPWYKFDLGILRSFDLLHEFHVPILIGASRKSFLGHLLDRPDPNDRLASSLAVAFWSAILGVAIIRTHDVAETLDTLKMADMLSSSDPLDD